MIKRAGENVAASEVEAAIREHPRVFDCAVIGVPDDIRDESILAVVVPSDDSLREDEVIAWCRGRLASFRVPQAGAVPRGPAPHRRRQDSESTSCAPSWQPARAVAGPAHREAGRISR